MLIRINLVRYPLNFPSLRSDFLKLRFRTYILLPSLLLCFRYTFYHFRTLILLQI